MSLKNWFKSKRVSILLGVIFAIITLGVFINFDKIDRIAHEREWLYPVFISPTVFCVLSFWYLIDILDNISSLRTYLGVDDLRPYMELSPSQMEDMCLRRLKVLASVWEDAQANYPMPFAKKRKEAETAFRRAYWFFDKQKCIKPTDWSHFFTKPETQK